MYTRPRISLTVSNLTQSIEKIPYHALCNLNPINQNNAMFFNVLLQNRATM